jgi:hypothetical protein
MILKYNQQVIKEKYYFISAELHSTNVPEGRMSITNRYSRRILLPLSTVTQYKCASRAVWK